MTIGKIHHVFALLCFSLFLTACSTRHWYKGNLHTHSMWSDGDDFPEPIMGWYKSQGYHFVGLSDHNILQEGEKWVTMPNNHYREEVFKKYLERYGEEWVDYEVVEGQYRVRLRTLEEYRGLFEEEGRFMIMPCEEISDEWNQKSVHINATNLIELIPPQRGESLVEVMQRNIDAVLAQRAATGQPMFPHINHPNFEWAVPLEAMKSLERERFFEVYNGHPQVHNYGDSSRIGTEEMWDQINIHYAQSGKPLMLGLATDDSHNYHFFGPEYSNAGRGWIQVQAGELTPAAIIEAMEAGNFYASTGVELKTLKVTGRKYQVTVKKEEGVNYAIYFIGAGKGDAKTRILMMTRGATAAYKFTGDELFVRAKIVSDKQQENPFQEGLEDVEVAWGQPGGQ